MTSLLEAHQEVLAALRAGAAAGVGDQLPPGNVVCRVEPITQPAKSMSTGKSYMNHQGGADGSKSFMVSMDTNVSQEKAGDDTGMAPRSSFSGRSQGEALEGPVFVAERSLPFPERDRSCGAAGKMSSRSKSLAARLRGEEEIKLLQEHEKNLIAWKQSSGLHTVEHWVKNYNQHPSPWPALLMIHGVPETTKRLRSKVENYAIYSALFMCVSIEMVMNPPHDIASGEDVLGEVLKRIFGYSFTFGIGCHMLCILIAMAFHNALNEAARDSDVFRMFSRGRAFLATVKCQTAFRWGCYADFLAMGVGISSYIGLIETVSSGLLLCFGVCMVFRQTSSLLYRYSSITWYWREEAGGKPDDDDPYDLHVPVQNFEARAHFNRNGKDDCEQTASSPITASRSRTRTSTQWTEDCRSREITMAQKDGISLVKAASML